MSLIARIFAKLNTTTKPSSPIKNKQKPRVQYKTEKQAKDFDISLKQPTEIDEQNSTPLITKVNVKQNYNK